MPKLITELPYDDWVAYIFDHAVEEPKWYFDVEAAEAELEHATFLKYVTRLFSNSQATLDRYSDAQVNQGLWFLVAQGNSDLHILRRRELSIDIRLACIDSIKSLFAATMVDRCTDHLSHIDEPGRGDLNSICYMWWDIFPLSGKPSGEGPCQIDVQCLSVMADILAMPSIACQESALHGLGHWCLDYPAQCQATIDAYLNDRTGLRPELRRYAEAARLGRVQ